MSPDPEPAVVDALRGAGVVFAEEEAAVLAGEARTAGHLELMLARRLRGEPLEQVVGWAQFHGLRVRVAPGVFVPRRRTELLVDLAVETLERHGSGPGPVVVDLCCGTGAIGVAITHAVPDVELHAADIDPVAVTVARQHVAKGAVHEGDLYDALPTALRGRVDVVVANAPYVPTAEIALMPGEARNHEHRVALDGGADGLAVGRRVVADAAEWLSPGGTLLMETSERQAPDVLAACVAAGLAAEVVRREETGSTAVRAISAAPGSSGTMTR